jgi:hypothetical protein
MHSRPIQCRFDDVQGSAVLVLSVLGLTPSSGRGRFGRRGQDAIFEETMGKQAELSRLANRFDKFAHRLRDDVADRVGSTYTRTALSLSPLIHDHPLGIP